MLRRIYIILLCLCCICHIWADGTIYTSQSVLSSGKWVKISVDETGIYKLTYAQLRDMGFSDPSKVSIHGYGGWPLEEDFSKPYIDDVPATAIYRGSDYILFYGRGPVKWEYDTTSASFIHTNNPYSNSGYYFVTDATETKDIQKISSLTTTAILKVEAFDDYVLHEVDQYSLNESGRELYGESFTSETSRDIKTFNVPGITNEEGKAMFRFIGRPTSGYATVSLSLNGTQVCSGTVASIQNDSNPNYTVGKAMYTIGKWQGEKSESIKANISYSLANDRNARLDYIRLQMERTLQPYGSYTLFRSIKSIGSPTTTFIIQNATSNTIIWDVTDCLTPTQIEGSLNGSQLSFTTQTNYKLREFVIIQTDQTFKSPEISEEIKNQDLHGLSQTDMVIISPSAFTSQAERLAQAHREKDGLKVTVVDPQKIYNEFSSGTPDATAYRRFMKMFYDRRTSDDDAPKYLLLFGDGAYDNRFLTDDWKKMSDLTDRMLLTYQTENSLDSYSYPVDNYFGILDDNSGKNFGTSLGTVKLGIGRFPVRTLTEATNAVDKVISYMNNDILDGWKNNLCFMADDGNASENSNAPNSADRGYLISHAKEADLLTKEIEKTNPEYITHKLYFDKYKKNHSSGNGSYPDVENELNNLFKSGLFLFNYTGHGNTQSLSDEKVIETSDIRSYSFSKLPLWITATCDFTRFDHHNTSAGEYVFLNSKSAGIALLTTTRVAFAPITVEESTRTINRYFIEYLFKKENNKYPTLGDVLKNTFNNSPGISDSRRKLGYALIGDPALRLNYPEYSIETTSVNGNASEDTITFSAMDKITVEGFVRNQSGNIATDFNGIIYPTVYDSRDTVTTLSNNSKEREFKFQDYLGVLFTGNDRVENGRFSFTFTVPLDISYSGKQGKMTLYAYDENTNTEANGYYDKYLVEGTNPNPYDDNEGPEIRALYLNDTTFVDGGKVNSTPFLFVRVWDESGVNITGSSLGHDITLVIDNQATRNYNLNGYYETIPNSNGEGMVRFLIPELSPGIHTAEFKIWDVMNNATTQTFTFEVVEGLKPSLSEIIAAPVPSRENVTFYLYHNRPESTIDITLTVYDMNGRIQWKQEEKGYSDFSKPYTITWDLRNSAGGRVRPGIYIYRATISSDKSKEVTKAQKIIVLAQ